MSDFTVTVLGSSGSYASPANPCTGYLVRTPGATVLLDLGPGTLGPLQAHVEIADLSAIVLTHCHPDHWMEMPVLRNVLTYFQSRAPMPVYSTAVTKQMHEAVSLPSPGKPSPFDWDVIDAESTLDIGDQHWSFRETDHPVETLAVRVDAVGRSFMFTADTGPGWHFTDFEPGIHTVLADASHLEEWEESGIPHMSAREAAVRAAEINAEKLVLTHLVPGSDPDAHRAEAEAAYGGSVEVALPGRTFEV